MHHILVTFVIGALSGGLASRSSCLRPAVRGLVKGGIAAKRKVETLTATASAEMQKLVNEARADLDQAGTEQHS